MSPLYLNPPPSSPIPFLELKGDQHSLDQVLGQIHDLSTNHSFSLSYQSLDKNHTSHESLAIHHYSNHAQEKVEKVLSHEKPNDPGQVLPSSSWPPNIGDSRGYNHMCSSNYKEGDKIEIIVNNNDQKYSRKWKPSKVRIMQKMMGTSRNKREEKLVTHHDHKDNNINNGNNNGIRVCSDCNTTTTPLWRSGPRGPKSLCNACGIRQRKARRAAMAAAAAAAGSMASLEPLPKPKVEDQMMRERESLDHTSHPLPLKKRPKLTMDAYNNNNNSHTNGKKPCFEDFALGSTSKDNYYIRANSQRAFPRDEEEGAILLMALSCGLACSS